MVDHYNHFNGETQDLNLAMSHSYDHLSYNYILERTLQEPLDKQS